MRLATARRSAFRSATARRAPSRSAPAAACSPHCRSSANRHSWSMNGDVWTDFPLRSLKALPDSLAHLVLVENPEHHPGGDYGLEPGGRATEGPSRLTFSGLSMLDPRLFEGCDAGQLCAEAAAGSRARGAAPDRPALRRRLARRRHARAACGARCRASARQGETPRTLVPGRLKCASRERGTHDKWLI